MKQLTDAERLEVAVSLLSERDVELYAERCRELELDCKREVTLHVDGGAVEIVDAPEDIKIIITDSDSHEVYTFVGLTLIGREEF